MKRNGSRERSLRPDGLAKEGKCDPKSVLSRRERFRGACFTLPTGTALDFESVGWRCCPLFLEKRSHGLIGGPAKFKASQSHLWFFSSSLALVSQSFVFPCYIKLGVLGSNKDSILVRETTCLLFASRIKWSPRYRRPAVPPPGKRNWSCHSGKGRPGWGCQRGCFPSCAPTAPSSSLSLCSHKVLLG